MAEPPFTPELLTQSWALFNTLQPCKTDSPARRRGWDRKEKTAVSRTTLLFPRPSLDVTHARVVPIILSCRRKGHSTAWRGRLLFPVPK